jgi:hypothetical protein
LMDGWLAIAFTPLMLDMMILLEGSEVTLLN